MKRRTLLHAGGAAAAGLLPWRPAPAAALHAGLPAPASLAEDLARALERRKALVVLVSLEGCPYCEIVRRSYLAPLRAEGQPVVQIEMAGSAALQDLQGKASTHRQVVRGFGVRVAPTVLFLGRDGRETAGRIAGMPIPDFYGAYLEQRLEAANRAAG